MTNLFERDTQSLIKYVLPILFGNVGRDVTALLMHDPDGVEQLPSQKLSTMDTPTLKRAPDPDANLGSMIFDALRASLDGEMGAFFANNEYPV